MVTSANPHGAPTPRAAGDVAASLGHAVDLIVDGGELTEVPSTLVNVRAADGRGRTRGRHRRRARSSGCWRRCREPGSLLAIETSCDETAAAVVDENGAVRSSVVASQIDLHASFGGVVPELASRAHTETITADRGACPRQRPASAGRTSTRWP